MGKEKNNGTYGECRCCMQKGHHKDLTKEYYREETREVYFNIFVECYNLYLLTNTKLSTLICNECVGKLHEAYNFKNLVVNTEKQMLAAIKECEEGTEFINVTTETNIEIKDESLCNIKAELSDMEIEEDIDNDEDNSSDGSDVETEQQTKKTDKKELTKSRTENYSDVEIIESPPVVPTASKNVHNPKKSINNKIDKLLEITGTISDNYKTLYNNQQTIMNQLNYLSDRMDGLTNTTLKQANERLETRTKGCRDELPGLPIKDTKSLEEFEIMIVNPDVAYDLKRKIAVVCEKGKGRGLNNAYTLVDIMFTRKFMTKCSWAGGSRQDSPKICFKMYKKTINFFFELVHQTDETYTKMECDSFLKTMTRNSNKRAMSKFMRTSTIRRRQKKSKLSMDIEQDIVEDGVLEDDQLMEAINRTIESSAPEPNVIPEYSEPASPAYGYSQPVNAGVELTAVNN